MPNKLARWKEKEVYIFSLPTYSPNLNIIEILRRQMKYKWLKPEDCASLEKLTKAIKELLNNLGEDYKINFENGTFTK